MTTIATLRRPEPITQAHVGNDGMTESERVERAARYRATAGRKVLSEGEKQIAAQLRARRAR